MFYANCNLAADWHFGYSVTSQADIDDFACDAGGGVVAGNLTVDDVVEYEIKNVNELAVLTR